MPIIAWFEGLKLTMYSDEHPPPHFHAKYAEHIALIDIETLRVLEGSLPRPKLRTVLEWAEPRKERLMEAWNSVQAKEKADRIE